MTFPHRPACFGCGDQIFCGCKKGNRFCPIHTPERYGELCRVCYCGLLAAVAGLT